MGGATSPTCVKIPILFSHLQVAASGAWGNFDAHVHLPPPLRPADLVLKVHVQPLRVQLPFRRRRRRIPLYPQAVLVETVASIVLRLGISSVRPLDLARAVASAELLRALDRLLRVVQSVGSLIVSLDLRFALE
eukprot:1067002-Prorocentrum_minimum.AAC.2